MDLNLNETIDHTLLKPEATYQDILKVISEAKEYQFKSVCIQPTHVALAAKELANSTVKVCTVIGFPLGANTSNTKVYEAREAIENGAREIDMVINIGALKCRNEQLVQEEISSLRKVCTGGIILKVIIETALLTEEEKILACRLVSQAKADFIKTSTGFSSAGASLEDVQLFKKHLDPNVQIKASGGIRTRDQAIAYINAGATRLGTSNGKAIVENSVANGKY